MLTFKRIDHFGQVVKDLDAQVALLEGLFGFTTTARWNTGNEHGVALAIPGRSAIDWEVLAPGAGDSPHRAFLEGATGPGVHHVAVEVEDVEEAVDQLRKLGVPFSEGANGQLDAQIEPQKRGEGLVFRFFDAAHGNPCRGAASESAGGGSSAPTLGVIGVDHLCHAYRDRDELARWYERVLGMKERWRTPDGEHDDLADLVLDVPGGQMVWEVIQPVGEESFIARFIETRGPAPHHVTFQVADWAKAVAACEAHGVPMFGENEGVTDGARWQDGFIHPKHTGGMLTQLFWEEKPGVWVRSDKVPSNG